MKGVWVSYAIFVNTICLGTHSDQETVTGMGELTPGILGRSSREWDTRGHRQTHKLSYHGDTDE